MATTQSDERWQFLRQWWEAMRPAATPIIVGVVSETSQRCGYGSMRIVPPYAEKEWSMLRDALELLSLFSLVDAPAFLSMTREYCTGIAGDSIKSDWRNFPDDEDFKGPLGVEVRLEDAFLGDANSSNARKELLERVASEQERKTLENGFTVPVEIVFFLSPHRAATATFETLVSLKSQMLDVLAESSTRMEEARRAAMRVFPFRLANVTIGANDETLPPAFMTTVYSHVKSGVITVGDVVMCSSDGERLGDFDRQKFADFVTAVCAPNGPAVIHDAFCSALTYSTGVGELVVDDMLHVHCPMSRRQRWTMLLYAVFSAEASNDIQCLGLGDFELTEGDLAWMRALFEAHDPIERLLLYVLAEDPLPTDVETPSSRIVVRSGATIQPCGRFTPLFDVETRKELTLYSYRSCGSGMEVIPPAFGNTIVPGNHILRTERIDGATHKWWNLDSHKIKSLYIRSFGDDSDPEYEQRMRNLASFIGIIGRPLETLGLFCDLP